MKNVNSQAQTQTQAPTQTQAKQPKQTKQTKNMKQAIYFDVAIDGMEAVTNKATDP